MNCPSKQKILVTTRFFDEEAARYLTENGFEIVTAGLPHDQDDAIVDENRFIELLDGACAWIVGSAAVTRRILEARPQLKIVARRGVGYDKVDTEAAVQLGRVVTITRGGNEPAVSDHAVAMMLALAKRLREGHDSLTRGHWKPLAGTELFQKTVGLVGFGEIARGVAQRLIGFEAKILAFDIAPNVQAAEARGVSLVSLNELFRKSDYISLHLPLLVGTKHMINATSMAQMKSGVIIINTARGGLINEPDLLDALDRGRVGGAGLDVFESETNADAIESAKKLLNHPKVIGSAHSAGSSQEALARANMIAVRGVIDVLDGRQINPCYIVADGRK